MTDALYQVVHHRQPHGRVRHIAMDIAARAAPGGRVGGGWH
jgi:hypothetical protein